MSLNRLTGSILRKSAIEREADDRSSSEPTQSSGERLFWNRNVRTFQASCENTEVKEEVFEQGDLDAMYANEMGFDTSGSIEHYDDESTTNSRRVSGKWDMLISRKMLEREMKQQSPKSHFAEKKGIPEEMTTTATPPRRYSSLDSFGFSFGKEEEAEDEEEMDTFPSTIPDTQETSNRKKGYLVNRMRSALQSFGSFGADPEAVPVNTKRRQSILGKIIAVMGTSGGTNDDETAVGGDPDDSHQSKSGKKKQRGSLLGIMISFTKTAFNGGTEDVQFTEKDPDPPQSPSEDSNKENADGTAKDGSDVAGKEQAENLNNSSKSKPSRRPARMRRHTTEDSLKSSMKMFDKLAAGKTTSSKSGKSFNVHTSFLTQKTASTHGSEDVKIHMGGDEGYDEKISSILYKPKSELCNPRERFPKGHGRRSTQ